MILFLDFDGVLHHFFPLPDLPHEENDYFSYWPRLKTVLDDYPETRVVVTSSWRISDSLMSQIPDSLSTRITGKTPLIKPRNRSRYPANYTPEPIRYLEIQKYLRTTKQTNTPWIALDDDPMLFPENCAQLIVCKDGFREREEAELRQFLRGVAG